MPRVSHLVFNLFCRTSPEYLFVEDPSGEFFCPVTYDLIIQPHLTSCCGKHLSPKAIAKIKEEGKACPLCREQEWSAELDTDLKHKVEALLVFCPNVDRGCKWKGKLLQFDWHVLSCSKKDAALIKELPKSAGYVFICTI